MERSSPLALFGAVGSSGSPGGMTFGPEFWLPLSAAFLYALGAIVMKNAGRWKAGPWRMTFVTNIATAIVGLPLFLLGGTVPSWFDLWQPFVIALIFLLGQLLTFVAISYGDVSIATPMLGLKIILVAVFIHFLTPEKVSPMIWGAAALATLAVVLLNMGGGGESRKRIAFTAVLSFAAAASYALFDVLLQHWAAPWGTGRFLPIVFLFTAVLSFGLIPLFPAPLSELPRDAWRWLLGGGMLIAFQALVFTSTLAIWRQAAESNVVYSSRGLWSVLLVWTAGRWLARDEYKLGGRVLAWRLAGAATLIFAIALLRA